MKIWTGAMVLALAASGIAHAQTSGGSPNLSPGEVLLQISADAEDQRPADDIAVLVTVNAAGSTAAEARAEAAAKLDRVIKALTDAGIPRGAIIQQPGTTAAFGFVGNEAFLEEPGVPVPPVKVPRRFANTTVRIQLTNYRDLARIQPALDAQDVTVAGPPAMTLRDNTAARQAAAAKAAALAKADAQAQTAALDMQISRLLRVANFGPERGVGDTLNSFAKLMEVQRSGGASNVITKATVQMDFALIPKK